MIIFFSKNVLETQKKVGNAGRNFGTRKNIRNLTQILEHGNVNAWNAKKRRFKNVGTGNAKGKVRKAGTQDTKRF